MSVEISSNGEYLRLVRGNKLSPSSVWTIAGWGKIVTQKSDTMRAFVMQEEDGSTPNQGLLWNDANEFEVYSDRQGIISPEFPQDGSWNYWYCLVDSDANVLEGGWYDGSSWVSASVGNVYTALYQWSFGNDTFDNKVLGGRLANIRLWNAALSQSELLSEKDEGVPQRVADLIGDWPLVEDAQDTTNNGYHLEKNSVDFYSSDKPPVSSDSTAPTFDSGPTADRVTDDKFDLLATLNENGTIYSVVVVDGATAPSVEEVKNGQAAGGGTPVASASTAIVAGGTQATLTLSPLSADTAYDTYSVAVDYSGNTQSSTTLTNVSTATSDTIAPAFVMSPTVASLRAISLDIECKIDEDGTVYSVIVGDGASAPSSSEVKNGQASGGGEPVDDNSTAATANSLAALSLTGLSPDTAYDVYTVAEDSAQSPNLQSSPSKNDTTTDKAPALSNASVTVTGIDSAYLTVTTDKAEGTLYFVVTQSSTAPSAFQIKGGRNENDEIAVDSGSTSVVETGEHAFNATNMARKQTYYAYFLHKSSAGADSNVASTASFETVRITKAGFAMGNLGFNFLRR
jgi:hypothetical protein